MWPIFYILKHSFDIVLFTCHCRFAIITLSGCGNVAIINLAINALYHQKVAMLVIDLAIS